MDISKVLEYAKITREHYNTLDAKQQRALCNAYLNDKSKFEVVGYSKDVYYNGKYFGSIRLDEMDRDTIGYYGRRTEITDVDIKFKNKKTIKAGSEIMTELFPLNGKLIK